MNKRNKQFIIFKSSIKKDKLHIYIKDKYNNSNIEISEEGLNKLKDLLNE